jgi:hypothetical protein
MGHIDMGNASIDNPSRAKRYSYRKLLGTNELPSNVEGMLGVDVRGHRRYNHDIVSGFLAASEVSPKHAGEIFLGHMLADKLSDQLRNSVGSGRRDLFETLVDIQHTDAANRRKQRIRF